MLNFKMWRPLRLLINVFITLLFFSSAFSQTPVWQWGKSFNGITDERGNSIAVDASGNVYTTGTFTGVDCDFDPGAGVFPLFSYNAEDFYVSKLDASGNFVWAVAIGGMVNDNGNSIAVDAAGNVYVTGVFGNTVDFNPSGAAIFNLTSNSFSNDVFVLKLNSAGNFVWAKALGGSNNDIGYAIALDASANIFVTGAFSGTADFDPGAGTFNLTATGNNDIFISKLDSAGNFMWAKGMGGATYAWGQGIAVDASGNVLVTGVFGSTVDFDPGNGTFNIAANGGYDVFIVRLDNSGNFSWAKGFGDSSMDAGNAIAADASGNVYTCGSFYGTVDFDPGAGTFNLTSQGSTDAFVSKLSSSGNFVWAKAIGATDVDEARGLAVDASGNVYVTGLFSLTTDFDPGAGIFNLTSAGAGDIFLCKLDNAGNFGWAKSVGGINSDVPNSVALSSAGNLHITGYYYSDTITVTSPLLNADTSMVTNDIFIAKTVPIPTGNSDIENAGSEVLIFPNPVEDQFTIYGVRFTVSNIEIYNALGEKVYETRPPSDIGRLTISVTDLHSGIYFIKLKSSAKIQTIKFLKE